MRSQPLLCRTQRRSCRKPALNLQPAYILQRELRWRLLSAGSSALIVVGFSQKQIEESFNSRHLAGDSGNSLGVHNEESDDHPNMDVCDVTRLPWPEFWKKFRRLG
jgi:hypothetical protein